MNFTKINITKYIFILLLCFFTIKTIIVPWSFFTNSSFRMDFYDLGLISNFLANTANGKIFFVDDYNLNHLSLHWTPTLFLLTPFYRFFESQFLTVILSNIIACFGIVYFFLFIYKNILNKFSNKFFIFSFVIFISFLFFSNKYINANFLAGHFEIIFTGFSLITLTMILENRAFYYIIIPFFLALGIREDMGLFLFFQILSLLLIPKKIILLEKRTKINIFYMMLICIIYVILNLKLFMPLMQAEKAFWINKFWSHWGNTWFEISINVLTHPLEVLNALQHSGVTGFNEAFFYLSIFNPLQWICIHIPGMILFLAETTDKNHLFWYNSAMLIPGIYISTLIGFLVLTEFLIRKFPKSINIISIFMISISILMIFKMNRATNSENYSFKSNSKITEFKKTYDHVKEMCNIEPILYSTDHKTNTFLPNSKTKFLLGNYQKSQITMIANLEKSDFSEEDSYQKYQTSVEKIKHDSHFKLLYQNKSYLIFYNQTKIQCKSST